jgi:hypothetical protein
MYSALMQEIEKGLADIKKNERKVVEITRTGKIVSRPFPLFPKKTEESENQVPQPST